MLDVEPRNLDSHRADVLASLCEVIVPGSERVAPVVYIDAIMGLMPEPQREVVRASIDALEQPLAGGEEALRPVSLTPEFQLVRALCVEAFYSDFVAPGVDAAGAWAEIDFKPPLAARLAKDWSYLGVAT